MKLIEFKYTALVYRVSNILKKFGVSIYQITKMGAFCNNCNYTYTTVGINCQAQLN